MPSAENLQNRFLLKYLAMFLLKSGYSTISSLCHFRLMFPISCHNFSWKGRIKHFLQLQVHPLPETERLLDLQPHLQGIPGLDLQE